MIRTLADALDAAVQPHSVHARPDAGRHHRHRSDSGGPGVRRRRIPLSARADLRQRDPGRRNQSHAAQDAGRPAGGDAGAPGDGRRQAAPAVRAVLRAGDAEPDRAGRDLSAARGPARPLHVQHRSSIIPAEDEEFEIVRRTTADVSPSARHHALGRGDSRPATIVRRVPVADHVTRYALHLARLTRPRLADVPDFVRDYVSWGAGPRASQYLVLGAKARAVLHGRYLRRVRRRPGGRLPGAAASHHDQLQRRGRRGQARRDHSPLDRSSFRSDQRGDHGWTSYQKYLDPQTLAKLARA